jgi:hypothetical protein
LSPTLPATFIIALGSFSAMAARAKCAVVATRFVLERVAISGLK